MKRIVKLVRHNPQLVFAVAACLGIYLILYQESQKAGMPDWYYAGLALILILGLTLGLALFVKIVYPFLRGSDTKTNAAFGIKNTPTKGTG